MIFGREMELAQLANNFWQNNPKSARILEIRTVIIQVHSNHAVTAACNFLICVVC